MKRRSLPEINTGSMADIAFLLLIFFLIATTMETDLGIMRKLPPLEGEITPVQVNNRNSLVVLINRDNKLMVDGNEVDIGELRQVAEEFIVNRDNKSDLPELKLEHFGDLGDILVTPFHVISIKSDRGTTYETYIAVQNEIVAAYSQLRDNLAYDRFGIHYSKLDAEMQESIAKVYPMRISEAEPNFQ